MSVLIIMFVMMTVVGCEPHTSVEWQNVKKIDSAKYAACLMDSKHEKILLEELTKQCEDYAEIKKTVKHWRGNTVNYTDKDLRNKLTDLEYEVTQNDGTERAGTSPLDKNYEPGIYVDKVSGEPLYLSIHKYDSGTGWPSFYDVIKSNVVKKVDNKLFGQRTEIRSKDGDSHLGHVFNDGPQDKTGLRYCMNGAALTFIALEEMEAKGYGEFIKQIKG